MTIVPARASFQSGQIFRQAHHLLTADATPGRRITCGFSYLQRIRFGGQIRLWQPDNARGPLRLGRLDWAAVRQVEILQESGDQRIESMEIYEGLRALKEHAMMRGDGLRLTIITAGVIDQPETANDQRIFDRTFKGRLRGMERMHWLDEFSRNAAQLLNQKPQGMAARLPHIYGTLNAAQVFGRTRNLPFDDATNFLDRVNSFVDHRRIEHDIMVGLKQPKSDPHARRKFNRLPERLYLGYMSALVSTFSHFGLMPTAVHMRSYGDHMKGKWSRDNFAGDAKAGLQSLVYH